MNEEITRESLIKRFAGKACKKMGRNSTKKELKEVHRIKMEMKDYMRKRMSPMPKPHILANISRHHEHYGDTPVEHERRK